MITSRIHQAVEKVSFKFKYLKDSIPIFDSWRVMKEKGGAYQGDCDDFALTCFWHYSGQSLSKFLWNTLVTHKYKIYRAKTVTGEYHIVGSVDGLWFDNWSRKALTKEEFLNVTKHRLLRQYIGPIIGIFMLLGLFS